MAISQRRNVRRSGFSRVVVTLIPLLRRRDESYDGLYDEK